MLDALYGVNETPRLLPSGEVAEGEARRPLWQEREGILKGYPYSRIHSPQVGWVAFRGTAAGLKNGTTLC